MQRPEPNEHKPYVARYISLVPEGNFIDVLKQNTNDSIDFFTNIPTDKEDHRYADGKWSIKEVLIHIADTERVMYYRALTGIRGDNKAIMYDMDQDLYTGNADVSGRTLTDILEEFSAIRTTGIKLFENITEEQSQAIIQLKDGGIFSVRAIGYMNIGHILHHINVIKERYLD